MTTPTKPCGCACTCSTYTTHLKVMEVTPEDGRSSSLEVEADGQPLVCITDRGDGDSLDYRWHPHGAHLHPEVQKQLSDAAIEAWRKHCYTTGPDVIEFAAMLVKSTD